MKRIILITNPFLKLYILENDEFLKFTAQKCMLLERNNEIECCKYFFCKSKFCY